MKPAKMVWAVPYLNEKTAKRFERLMRKPWICKVKKTMAPAPPGAQEAGEAVFSCDAAHLKELVGSRDLERLLNEHARKKGEDFDIRPFVRREAIELMGIYEKRGPPGCLKAMNTVRAAVGLKPLGPQKPWKIIGMGTAQDIIKKLEDAGYMVKLYNVVKVTGDAKAEWRKDPRFGPLLEDAGFGKDTHFIWVWLWADAKAGSVGSLLSKSFKVRKVVDMRIKGGRGPPELAIFADISS